MTPPAQLRVMADPDIPEGQSFSQDAKEFFGWLSGLSRYRGAGAPLTTQDRQDHISRLVPFQPRVPLSEELQAQRAARELAVDEAQKREASKAELRRREAIFETARRLWMKKNTVGPGGQYPGALNRKATDHLLKVQRFNDQEKRIEEASFNRTPLDVQL